MNSDLFKSNVAYKLVVYKFYIKKKIIYKNCRKKKTTFCFQ